MTLSWKLLHRQRRSHMWTRSRKAAIFSHTFKWWVKVENCSVVIESKLEIFFLENMDTTSSGLKSRWTSSFLLADQSIQSLMVWGWIIKRCFSVLNRTLHQLFWDLGLNCVDLCVCLWDFYITAFCLYLHFTFCSNVGRIGVVILGKNVILFFWTS